MYCPNCGSSNQAEVKFCKHCGTNLGVVSEALTGKLAVQSGVDDRMAKLMRDYYRGRRDSITGAVLIPSGLFVMVLMVAAGMNPIGAFFIICWIFFWGVSALAGGLGKWISSAGEMKALGYGSQSQFQGTAANQFASTGAPREIEAPDYSTGPVGYAGSVTEQTTRQLDEHKPVRPLEREHERR